MAKASQRALVSMAICLLSSLVGFAYAGSLDNKFVVLGKIYCDTCRVEFETKLSEPIPGAKVKLECRKQGDETVTYSHEAETDANSVYKIPVEGNHEEQICEVSTVSSPRADCNEKMESFEKAQVELTSDDGLAEPSRKANNLGFKKKVAVPGCAQVLKEMGFPLTE
ncbi:hypothetical protein Gotur_004838 [Gossypium turneri]